MTSGIVERVRTILPVLEEHRLEADAAAHMAPAVVTAAHDAGVFRLFAPRECGGPDATYPEILQVFEDLGTVDPTVGWHAGNCSGIGFAAAYLPEACRTVPFDGTVGPFGFCAIVGGTLVPTEGGFVLSGRWPFLTGALDASWAAINAAVEGSPTDVRMCLVRADQWTVERTWDGAAAMRGTGSHAVSVRDQFVSDVFAHDWTRPIQVDRPLHRLPTISAGQLTNAAIVLGITRRVVEEVTASLTTRVVRADGVAMRDKVRMQREVAAATAEVAILHAGIQDVGNAVWDAVSAGRISRALRGQVWSTMYVVVDRCRDLVGRLATLNASSFYSQGNRVEAALRDVHAIASAMETFRDLQEAHGRVLLGLRPDHPLF